MKKLTLVSFMCRGKTATAFIKLPVINGSAVISQKSICDLFYLECGFYPQIGETITIL